MGFLTAYLGFGLLFVWMFEHLGKWASPNIKSFEGKEKVILSLYGP